MQLRPLNDQVLLQRLEDTPRTKGGIYKPDIAKEKSSRCKVIEVGPGQPAPDRPQQQLHLDHRQSAVQQGEADQRRDHLAARRPR